MTYDTLEVIRKHRVLPVLIAEDAGIAQRLATALSSANLPLVEVTLRTSAAPHLIKALSQSPGLTVGAGTVLNPQQVDLAVAQGAKFIVSPGMSQEVIKRAAYHDILVIPGVSTATDVQNALAAQCHTVKFFPAQASGGPQMIQALSAPFPQVSFIPTGGIGEHNAKSYLQLSQVIAIGGSWMFPANLINDLANSADPTAAEKATAELATTLRAASNIVAAT